MLKICQKYLLYIENGTSTKNLLSPVDVTKKGRNSKARLFEVVYISPITSTCWKSENTSVLS